MCVVVVRVMSWGVAVGGCDCGCLGIGASDSLLWGFVG